MEYVQCVNILHIQELMIMYIVILTPMSVCDTDINVSVHCDTDTNVSVHCDTDINVIV